MKRIVKNIFTAIVALTLLIGTTGIQLYKHNCAAHNFSAVSLFEAPVCEKDHQVVEETDDCCKTEVEEINEPSCCESCLLYTSPSPRDRTRFRMPSSA